MALAIDKIELPIWVWRYFSTGDVIQILHVVEKEGDYFFLDTVYFVHLSSKEVSVDYRKLRANIENFKEYSLMNKFSSKIETIKSIFTKLEIKSLS